MLKTALAACLLICSLVALPAHAQSTQSGMPGSNAQPTSTSDDDIQLLRKNIRDQRKKITAANLQLSADQATKFWPLYDQYISETVKINDNRWALIKTYAAHYHTMTDEMATDYIQRSSQIDTQLIALRVKYVPIFEQVLSKKQAAQWYQIDRRLEQMINVQLSSMLPMIDSSK